MNKNTKFLTFLIIIAVIGAIFLFFNFGGKGVERVAENSTKEQEAQEKFIKKEVQIQPGSTYAETMNNAGIDYQTAMDIFHSAEELHDLSTVRAGKRLELFFDKQTGEFIKLVYKMNSEQELSVKKNIIDPAGEDFGRALSAAQAETPPWQAQVRDIPYKIKIKKASGVIKSSVYEAALAAGIDERAIVSYAHAFQWTIDFAYDPRAGDTFEFIFEERYLDGKYIMPGRVLAGVYNNQGKKYFVYYFKEDSGNTGYFDQNGNSVQKIFLKAPLDFKYISSGFTTGRRYVSAFNVATGHRAIDYAADIGTPIKTVGAGTVVFAGWDARGYGNRVSVRHNETYTTNYAHMSKIAVKRGQKVEQGEIIGYVGSTGFSTGPHLHFEMVKNGVKINPLHEELPPGKAIEEKNKAKFFEQVEEYKKILNSSN